MAVGDYLNRSIEGWAKGDTQIPTGSLAENSRLDDSNSGKITKQAVGEYLSGLWQIVEGIRGKTNGPLLLSVHLPAADRLGQDHRDQARCTAALDSRPFLSPVPSGTVAADSRPSLLWELGVGNAGCRQL